MKYPIDITVFLQNLIESIDFTCKIESVETDAKGNFILKLNDIFHSQPLFEIEINGRKYKIISTIECDNKIVVSGSEAPPIRSVFNLYPPKFFHGTAQQTNNELSEIPTENKFPNNKTPMIFLAEPFVQTWIKDVESPFEREVECSIFFLTGSEFSKFTTNDFYEQCIRPMDRMLRKFIDTLENHKSIGFPFEGFDTINRTKFGVKKNGEGNYFSDNLSGIEIPNLKFKINKRSCVYDCEC